MGSHWHSNLGYGVLVIDNDDNDFDAICEEEVKSDVLTDITVGDMVLGEDMGLFFMTEDVAIKMSSSALNDWDPNADENDCYISEYVEEFTDYTVDDSITEHANTLADGLKAKGYNVRVGAFKVSDFG